MSSTKALRAQTLLFSTLLVAVANTAAHTSAVLPKASKQRVEVAQNGMVNQAGGPALSCQGTDDTALLRTSVAAARGDLITISPGQTCATSETVIANLRIMKGGLLKTLGTRPVTITGMFEAGPYQVFSGSANIVFTPGTVESVSTAWFGDCVAELGAPLNKAIRSIAAAGGRIQLPTGTLKQTTSVNLTDIKSQSLTILGSVRGTIINAQLAGIAFDCTGSQFLEFRDFSISGNAATTPAIGFLFARNSTHDSAGRNHLYNVGTMGNFKVAAVYNYASEEFRAYDCYFTNSENDKPVVILTADNVANIASAYTRIDSGPQSMLDTHFIGSAINAYGGGNSSCLVLRGANAVSFSNTFFVNKTYAFVYLDANTYPAFNIDFNNVTFDGSGNATYGFLVKGAKEIAYLTIENLLDYGIKPAAQGGRTLFGDRDSSLSFLTLKRLHVPSGAYIDTHTVTYSDIDAGLSGTLESRNSISNSLIRAATNKIVLARPDQSLKNTIFYIDSGTIGLTLPVHPNNRAAVAAGLPVGSLYRTGTDPDQICIVH